MYIHMCVNPLSPAQPSPYIGPRLFICAFDKQESHHLAAAALSRYDERSGTILSETKRRKRNSYHPRSHQNRFKKGNYKFIYIHTNMKTYSI